MDTYRLLFRLVIFICIILFIFNCNGNFILYFIFILIFIFIETFILYIILILFSSSTIRVYTLGLRPVLTFLFYWSLNLR
jgi:hypothetical protein